ncbi:MAG TPA: hypothetical protein VKH83_04760 [Methylomirabilota bacterium]|nr:hypothetical protein [Methylomirabilota bacterium]
MRKWIGALSLVWLLWSDLSIIAKDNPIDTVFLRWLAGVPRFQTDQILAGTYATSDECKMALERHIGTLKAINDSWSSEPFEGSANSGTIHYYRNGLVYARAELRCAEQP